LPIAADIRTLPMLVTGTPFAYFTGYKGFTRTIRYTNGRKTSGFEQGGTMNAIELLKADHKTVDKLFQQIEATETEEHKKIFEQIYQELEVHAHIEETIFYPALKEKGDDELKDLTLEAVEEHRQMKMFLKEISSLTDDSEKLDPKLKVLIEDTRHHVMEEEGEMFKMVEEQFDAATIEEWGTQMAEEKKKFQKTLGKSA
jgi:hemerythrin superfamily protein